MTSDSDNEKPLAGMEYDLDERGENEILAHRLGAEVAARVGPREEQAFSISALDAAGALAGGLNGASHWRWLYVRHLWVSKPWRGRGLGRALLRQAESLAGRRRCVGIYLDTFDRGAVAFYQRCGFDIRGAIEDFPPGHRRTYLARRLAGTEEP